MKIKQLLTKTLLVAAGLLVGTSAWADKATLNPTGTAQLNLETNTTTATSWNANQSSVRNSGNYIGTFTTNTVVITKFDASTTLEGKTLVKAELKFHSICTTSGKNSTLWAAVLNNVSWAVTDVSNGNINVKNFADYSKTTEIQNVGSSGADVTLDVTSWLNSDDDKVIGFGIYTATGREQQITNLTLEVTYSSEVLYTATFTENNSLTPTVTIYSDEGRTTPVLNGALADATTYYYRAVLEGYNDYDGSFTVASANPSISFTMIAKPRYTFTVNAVNSVGGAVIQTYYTDNDSYDGKKHYVSFPAYITGVGNAVLYSKDNATYYQSFTSASTEATQTQSYTAYSGEAWFFEGEDVTDATKYTTSTYRGRTSSGSTGVLSAKTVTSLDAGCYKITARVIGKNDNTCSMYKTSTEGEKIFDVKTNTNGATGVGYITLDATTAIVANGGYYTTSDNGFGFDYILIEKVTAVPVTAKTTGTTFSSAYAIDCAKLPDGVKAYKVASINKTEKKAVLAEVTEAVKAETGLILIAETAGTFNIPVAATGTDISSTNLLKAAVTATEVTAGQAYGLKDGKFVKLNAGNVPAGKAYLLASDITNAPELDIDFGGTTAITNTNCAKDTNIREVYNLNGQRVAQPTRGLYIQNGRKVILK